ncbi:MAG: phosphatidylglycerophosphatase A [Rhodopila sp.]
MTFARWVLAGSGTGFAPIAPGTFASLAALVAGAAMLLVSPWLVAVAALLAIAGGFLALNLTRVQGDPGWVVIDEFAGQWISLVALSRPSPAGLLAAFLLFRLLDIAKPGPVGWADRQHGAFGIMMDDVIAGVVVAIVLACVRLAWPEVGL